MIGDKRFPSKPGSIRRVHARRRLDRAGRIAVIGAFPHVRFDVPVKHLRVFSKHRYTLTPSSASICGAN